MQHFSPSLAAVSLQLINTHRRKQSALLAVLVTLLLGGCQLAIKQPADSESPPDTPAVELEPEFESEPETEPFTDNDQSECQCPPVEVCDTPIAPPVAPPVRSCPPPVILNATQARTLADMLVIGRVENVYLLDKLKSKAWIDTGSELTSVKAQELEEFERDGKPWVRFKVENDDKKMVNFELRVKRFVSVKQAEGEPLRRVVVSMSIALGELEERIEVALMENSSQVYDVVIGRNFLRDRAIVDVSKKFTASLPTK